MADSHHSVPPSAGTPPREVVFRDVGGWISGPSADAELVDAALIRPGDRLILDDFTIGEVLSVRVGMFWITPDDFGAAVAINWHEPGGTASGVLHRALDATLQIVKDGAP
jgi:hypothetical protein